MNTITIVGRVGRDAETRYMPNGDPVLSFSVADDQGKGKPSIWWNCSLFGKRAESLAPYIVKGAKVAVSGSVTQREYTGKQGNAIKSQEIRVNEIDPFCGGAKEHDAQSPQRPAQNAPSKQSSGFDDFDSDVPF